MTRYDKIEMASRMFVEAHRRFDKAARDIDYVVALLLSSAVCGIVSPLLIEQDASVCHALLASLFKKAPPEGLFRLVYDGLTHAGLETKTPLPSVDVDIDADLPKEAAWMLEAVREDLSKLVIERGVLDQMSDEFLSLIREPVE